MTQQHITSYKFNFSLISVFYLFYISFVLFKCTTVHQSIVPLAILNTSTLLFSLVSQSSGAKDCKYKTEQMITYNCAHGFIDTCRSSQWTLTPASIRTDVPTSWPFIAKTTRHCTREPITTQFPSAVKRLHLLPESALCAMQRMSPPSPAMQLCPRMGRTIVARYHWRKSHQSVCITQLQATWQRSIQRREHLILKFSWLSKSKEFQMTEFENNK